MRMFNQHLPQDLSWNSTIYSSDLHGTQTFFRDPFKPFVHPNPH